jgi:hypothetical protein
MYRGDGGLFPSDEELEKILTRARAFCGYPRIMDPELVINPAGHPHAAKLEGEFGIWEPSENRVYLNLAEICEKLGMGNLEAVCVYQLLHYALAPFDMRTSLRLTASAKLALEEVKDRGRRVTYEEALSIQRLFCDMVNVTYAARHGMREEMISLYLAMDRAKGLRGSKMWKFILCCFEELWDAPHALVGKVPRELREDARRLAARMLDRPFAASGWEDKVRFLVGYLHKYYEDPKEMDESRIMDHGIDEMRNRSAEQMLRSLAQEMGMRDFKELVGGIGAGTEVQALVWYYRDLSRRYEVRFRPVRNRAGEEVPHAPLAWGMADPFDRLDLPYTLYTAGKAVPTLTTKQWEKARLEMLERRKAPPDVIIILDASGSMTNPSSEVANAVLAGFVMARSAANLGAKVGLVVYSDQQRSLVVDPVWDVSRVEEGLVTYYGGGTVFPVQEFRRLAAMETHRPKHFCLISDTEITNIAEASFHLGEALRLNPENSGSVFLIDQTYSEKAESIRKAGYDIFPVTRGQDLVRVVAGKAQELYS